MESWVWDQYLDSIRIRRESQEVGEEALEVEEEAHEEARGVCAVRPGVVQGELARETKRLELQTFLLNK